MTDSSRRDVPATVTAIVPAPAACADVAGPLLENAVTGVLITGALSGLLVAAGAAHAPVDQVDAHVAAARAAPGPDYRPTFVNL